METTEQTLKQKTRKLNLSRIDPLIIALLIALAALVVVIGIQKPNVFFLPKNLLNIGQAVTLVGLVTLAQTVIIISGGMDLSVGSIVALSSIAIGLAMEPTNNMTLGIAVGLLIGGILGFINGLLITVFRMEAVIATLGTMAVFRGAAYIATNGAPIGGGRSILPSQTYSRQRCGCSCRFSSFRQATSFGHDPNFMEDRQMVHSTRRNP